MLPTLGPTCYTFDTLVTVKYSRTSYDKVSDCRDGRDLNENTDPEFYFQCHSEGGLKMMKFVITSHISSTKILKNILKITNDCINEFVIAYGCLLTQKRIFVAPKSSTMSIIDSNMTQKLFSHYGMEPERFHHSSQHDTLTQCCFNIDPPSTTLSQHCNNNG